VRVELHPEARAEVRAAAIWYDERREGLGSELVDEVGAALERIGRTPESSPPWPGLDQRMPVIRRFILQRFPYAIAFERQENTLLVLAVAHVRQRPLYWLTRATP
jgi:hypothetical protein